jgi:hypothetical protein
VNRKQIILAAIHLFEANFCGKTSHRIPRISDDRGYMRRRAKKKKEKKRSTSISFFFFFTLRNKQKNGKWQYRYILYLFSCVCVCVSLFLCQSHIHLFFSSSTILSFWNKRSPQCSLFNLDSASCVSFSLHHETRPLFFLKKRKNRRRFAFFVLYH